MRMQHKEMETSDDLVLKFKSTSPHVLNTYKPFESLPIQTDTRPQSTTPADIRNMERQWAHCSTESTLNQQSSMSSTKKMFEERIKRTEIEEALQAPRPPSQTRPSPTWKQRPMSDIYCDVYLEPGPEPELCFAPKPKLERKKSLVETLEENIEKQLQTEPARIPPGGVRLIPARRDPPIVSQPNVKRYSAPVEMRPEVPLEPFPFTVPEQTENCTRPIVGPPATPSKFIKGTFSDTNYESDFSDYSYFEKKFKHVAPPRPKSTEPLQPHITHPETPKYDFSAMPLKQMIQNGSPIPLTTHYPTTQPQKSRPASGYIADTEDHSSYQNHAANRIYDQVGQCAQLFVFFCSLFALLANCKLNALLGS